MSQRDAHESYAVAAGKLHWIALIMAATLVAIVVTMYALSKTWLREPQEEIIKALPPMPRLQPYPAKDLANERAREESLLNGYAWIDSNAGVARIPIDRAMQLSVRASQKPATGAAQ